MTTRYVTEVDRDARRSELRDTETGITEVAAFVDLPQGGFLATITTRGPDEPRAAVLICNSVHAEGLKNHRRETLFARHLAAAGIGSVRFDYRGAGNSSGSAEAQSVTSMREDVEAARRHVAEQFPGIPVAVVATRLATPVVGEIGDGIDAVAVVGWQPVLDYPKFFRDVDRTKALQDRAEAIRAEKEGRTMEPRPATVEQFASDGVADVMGFSYGTALHDSFGGIDALETLGRMQTPLLLVQMSQREQVQKPIAALAAAREDKGLAVDLEVVAGEEENWWFRTGVQGFQTEEDREITLAVMQRSLAFIDRHVQGGSR